MRSSDPFTKNSRWNQAAFIQHSYKGDLFGTEIGLRHDKNQQFGSANTWNAALSLPVGQANEFILSYSEGFRVPTFNDLYWTFDGWTRGNPNLSPEKSKSYELQWRSQLTDTVRLESSIYRTDIRDSLTYISDPITFQGQTENVDTVRVNGFDTSLQHEFFGAHGVFPSYSRALT